jgi:hypothetical protein
VHRLQGLLADLPRLVFQVYKYDTPIELPLGGTGVEPTTEARGS